MWLFALTSSTLCESIQIVDCSCCMSIFSLFTVRCHKCGSFKSYSTSPGNFDRTAKILLYLNLSQWSLVVDLLMHQWAPKHSLPFAISAVVHTLRYCVAPLQLQMRESSLHFTHSLADQGDEIVSEMKIRRPAFRAQAPLSIQGRDCSLSVASAITCMR